MDALVSALSECQEKMDTGYLSAFPTEFFDKFEAIQPVWAPYYTIHKILAGLLDQYTIAGNVNAFKMMTWMVDYFYKRVQNVIIKYPIERHWESLNEETGGMNDVLYRLFSITGDQKHLVLAHLFDKPCFLGVLAVKADSISGFHSNTHIPIVVGTQMRYEYTGNQLYKDVSTFFMDIVNSSHTYATGGTSSEEFWQDPKRLASFLSSETEESCTTYNMLKVSRNLFRWTKDISYADYYERAITNGVLSIQRGREPGRMIYMLPLHPGGSKARTLHSWGSQFDDFWCCYGTGIESFSKLGDSIYFEEEGNVPAIYIIQYISSTLDWKSGKVLLTQEVEPVVSWDHQLKITITVSTKQKTGKSAVNMRIPSWTNSNGVKAKLNHQDLPMPTPGKFLVVSRNWNSGDKINLEFPLTLRTEAIKDDRKEYSSIQAILYGPYLLAGLSKGDWDIKTGQDSLLVDWITPIPADYNSNLISFVQYSGNTTMVLTNSNYTVKMGKYPESGTDSAVAATYRLVVKNPKGSKSAEPRQAAIGNEVMLEPFDLPGMFLVHQGTNEELKIVDSLDVEYSSGFLLLAGLDGKNGSVSLESKIKKGCYVYNNHGSIKLSGSTGSSTSMTFKSGASFEMQFGRSEYNPISFVSEGLNRNYLLTPLLSLRDESYTVYFNIQS
ncbi:aminoacyl-tRNA synthetase [Lithospermum erythrorhizon]|uniref:Aminoacyl-tRNA synthetase n=1 Tax=Lithospermum erythrorhizon TaxID=34254 RepID=A0AAV3Q8S0_LITER